MKADRRTQGFLGFGSLVFRVQGVGFQGFKFLGFRI